MAGRPKRRAKLAAQWAEVDRAAGRTSNAGRPKRRARLAAEAAARGTVSVPAAAPSAALTDLIETRDAADAQCRRAEKQFRQARYVHHAAERNDYIDESDRMDAEREYHNTVEALEEARRRLAVINKALAAARRTPNAGRPKRRARIAAQWAEVDRAAGVKVPRAKRKRTQNPDLTTLRAEVDEATRRREAAREALNAATYTYTRSGGQHHAETLRQFHDAGTAYRAADAEFKAARRALGHAQDVAAGRTPNGERFRAFDAGPKHEKNRRYTVVDTKISMYVPGLGEFYDGEQYGTDYTGGRRIVITARGNGFSTDGLDFGAEIELADVPARYRKALETFKRGSDR